MPEISPAYQINCKAAENGNLILSQFADICENPRKATEELLLKILKDNAETEYGKKYHFADIHSLEEYSRTVPVITYDDISDDIERMKEGEKNVLTAYPFAHMNETSGTTGKRKAVPLTSEQEKIHMKYGNQIFSGILDKALGDDWKYGRTYCNVQGNHVKLNSGITLGSASSIMAEACKGGLEPYSSMLKSIFTSPPEAMTPAIGKDTTYLHIRFAMSDKNITGILAGFITTVCTHMTYIRKHYELLIDDIEKGTIDPSVEMPEELRESLQKKLIPMPERAAELREIFRNGADFPFMTAIWPKLQYCTSVGGDGFSVYDEMLKREFSGGKIHRLYTGITASEGLWSAPVALDDLRSVIVPDSAVMEFLPVEAGDDFSKIRQIDELEVGKTYEFIITNLNGFYRYRMSDAVRVVDFWHKTPMVQFMYRVNKTINLACEKTTEAALRITAEKTAERLGFNLIDYEVYPDTSSFPPKYVFLIEAEENITSRISQKELEKVVLEELCKANGEFETVYEDAEIQAPECWFEWPQTQLLYLDREVYKGANASQLKPVHVISNENQRKFFMALRNPW